MDEQARDYALVLRHLVMSVLLVVFPVLLQVVTPFSVWALWVVR